MTMWNGDVRRRTEAAARDKTLEICREIQLEMGAEADGLSFTFEGDKFAIHGPTDVAKRFHERLTARFGK